MPIASSNGVQLVLDTNTIISGLLWDGTRGRLIDAAKAGRLELVSSTPFRTIVWGEHEAIAGAIARGDGARASRLIEQHGLSASVDLAAQLARKRKIAAIQGERR